MRLIHNDRTHPFLAFLSPISKISGSQSTSRLEPTASQDRIDKYRTTRRLRRLDRRACLFSKFEHVASSSSSSIPIYSFASLNHGGSVPSGITYPLHHVNASSIVVMSRSIFALSLSIRSTSLTSISESCCAIARVFVPMCQGCSSRKKIRQDHQDKVLKHIHNLKHLVRHLLAHHYHHNQSNRPNSKHKDNRDHAVKFTIILKYPHEKPFVGWSVIRSFPPILFPAPAKKKVKPQLEKGVVLH